MTKGEAFHEIIYRLRITALLLRVHAYVPVPPGLAFIAVRVVLLLQYGTYDILKTSVQLKNASNTLETPNSQIFRRFVGV